MSVLTARGDNGKQLDKNDILTVATALSCGRVGSEGTERYYAPLDANYTASWPNTTSAWAGWRKFNIPVDGSDGVHSLLICTSSTLEAPTCH
jgi:hypothetical protein